MFPLYINKKSVEWIIIENNTRICGTEHLSQFAKEDITKNVKTVKVIMDELKNSRKLLVNRRIS